MTPTSCDRQVGPYRIERELGRGGMGVVYLATRSDREYSKQVAIKLIHNHRGGDELASRFRAERQILANLEHPNIARLLDGGTTPEGDPYIAMEYVRDGVPIDDWCSSQNQLTTAQKLEKFLAICSAVQHAHQHLIVHRDLKPGNILVTPEGDVKLLDFGIARPLAPLSRDLAAASGSIPRSMTPEYASPEQLAGQPVGTASDIYSLGVILFEMLIGKRPETDQLTQPSRTLWGNPVTYRPSVYHGELLTLDRMPLAIPADLASIILMALREDPNGRYSSAGEMRRDVERFLDGEAVLAHPNRFPYPAIKFTLRHKLPITAVVLVMASLAGGIAATKRESSLADAQRLRAEEREQDADRQRRLAVAQSAEAERSRQLAEQQSKVAAQKSAEADDERLHALEQRDLTMKLATSLVGDLDASIAHLAGSVPTRKLLVSKAIETMEQLYRLSPEDPKVLVNLAGAYQSLGTIQRSRYASSLGDTEGALKSYQRSLDFATAADKVVSAAAPAGGEVRGVSSGAVAAAYAGAYAGFGDVKAINGDHSGALEFYLKAIPYAERSAQAVPVSAVRLRMPMIAYKKAGDMYRSLRRQDEAEACLLKAAQAAEAFAAAFPGNPSVGHDRIATITGFGHLLQERERYDEALAQFKQAIHLAEQASLANPTDSTVKRDLFVAYSRAGMVEYEREKDAAAHAYFVKALEFAEERFQLEKGNLQASYDLADAHFHLYQTFDSAGRREEAARHLHSSAELTRGVAKLDPNSEQTREFTQRVEEALAGMNKPAGASSKK